MFFLSDCLRLLFSYAIAEFRNVEDARKIYFANEMGVMEINGKKCYVGFSMIRSCKYFQCLQRALNIVSVNNIPSSVILVL